MFLVLACLVALLALGLYFYLPLIVSRSATVLLSSVGFAEFSFEPALPGLRAVNLKQLRFTYPTENGGLSGTIDDLSASYNLFGREQRTVSGIVASGGKISFTAAKAATETESSRGVVPGSSLKELLLNLPLDELRAENVSIDTPFGNVVAQSFTFAQTSAAVLVGKYRIHDLALAGTLSLSPTTGKMHAKFSTVNRGLKIADLELNAELLNDSRLRVTASPPSTAEFPGLLAEPLMVRLLRDLEFSWGGEAPSLSATSVAVSLPQLKLSSLIANPDAHVLSSSKWSVPVQLRALDLPALLALYPQQGLAASGAIDADFTVQYTPAGLSIKAGRLASVEPGGTIQYDSSKLSAASQPGLAIAFEALKNFLYHSLAGTVELDPSGKLLFALSISGHNPEWQNGRAVDLNINLEENIFKLMETIRLTTRIEEELDEVLKSDH